MKYILILLLFTACAKSLPVKEETVSDSHDQGLLIIGDTKCLNGAVDLWTIRMERRLKEAYPAKQ